MGPDFVARRSFHSLLAPQLPRRSELRSELLGRTDRRHVARVARVVQRGAAALFQRPTSPEKSYAYGTSSCNSVLSISCETRRRRTTSTPSWGEHKQCSRIFILQSTDRANVHKQLKLHLFDLVSDHNSTSSKETHTIQHIEHIHSERKVCKPIS